MSRLISLVVAAAFLLSSPGRLTAQTPPPWGTDLIAWVGKYPTHQQAGRTKHLLELPAVRVALNSLLSRADLRLVNSVLAVEKPVAQVDRFVVVEQCMPHDCPGAHAMIVLDSKERRLWVGIFERTGKKVSTRWYGSTDYLLLPETVLDSFRRAHTPE